ncbi:MAG: Hsp20/alpha crystallin family protein [Candidatus Neomarinimicrobiota bacterium]
MTLIKWTQKPLGMFNEMDNMISSIMNNDWNQRYINKGNWNPEMDIEESDDKYIINADIPGLNKKDIKINIVNGALTISGERTHQSDKNKDYYHYRERTVGTFKRSFDLPKTVEHGKVTAKCEDGILTIKLPKTKSALPKEREIKVS